MPSEAGAIHRARDLLASWLETPRPRFRPVSRGVPVDLLVDYGRVRLVVEMKRGGDSTAVAAAIDQLHRYVETLGRNAVVPVVAVPFMGDVGKRRCAEAGFSWFDLSGNAHLVAPGLRILVEGRPNRFLRRGRPSSVFAPKSARIVRRLLLDPSRSFRQQELARETGLDDGFTSRIVRRLEEDGLVVRPERGLVHVRDPDILLDAWSEHYDFGKHDTLRGHVTARTGEDLLGRLGQALKKAGVRHGATGLGAAWLLSQFAGFRVATLYVEEVLDDVVLHEVGFREEPRGANVWIVIPNDIGVLDGASEIGGIACVHPVQAYLDLGAHPERAKEAAEELRARKLRWKT